MKLEMRLVTSGASDDGTKKCAVLEVSSDVILTSEVQKEVRIRIKERGSKRKIPEVENLFSMAEDRKSFQLGFGDLSESELYRVSIKYGEVTCASLIFSGSGELRGLTDWRPPALPSSPRVDFTAKKWTKLGSLKSLGGEGSLIKPWGGCVLRNGVLVISTATGQVKMYGQNMEFTKNVTCQEEGGIDRPADLEALNSGDFALKDHTGIRILGPDGRFVGRVVSSQYCYGLAQDQEDRLWFLETRRRKGQGRAGLVTWLMCYDVNKEQLEMKVTLEEITGIHCGSKVRFMSYFKEKLYITDLGLDKVYIWDIRDETMEVVEDPGRAIEPSSWSGTAVDDLGNLMIADYKNHRLCVYSERGSWVKDVKVPDRRPSNVVLDRERGHLYLLNLRGREAVIKYSLLGD